MSEDRKYSPQCGAARRSTVSSFYHKGRFRKIFRCLNAWTSICVIGSAAQPPPSPAVYSEILCTSPTVNLLTRLRFLHFFAEKLRSSSESRSRRQCWILMILVPHGSTSKIYKAAGLAWEHNKWEEVITRGHFDTSDITLSFRSTCTCVKAPLMQEPRLLSQTHTNTVTIDYMQNYKTRTEVYLHADEHGLDYTRKKQKCMRWKQEGWMKWWRQGRVNSSIRFRLSQNFDVQLKILRK